MECKRHKKQSVAQCNWCGEGICRYCKIKSLGRQKYCEECSKNLGPAIQRKQIERMREV